MSRPLFTNNASTVLARAITPTDTILQLTAGTGQYFPQPTIGDYFMLTLVQINNPEVSEIVECIERVGDVLTVVRGQEGTAPQIFNLSDSVELRITAGSLNLFAIGGGGGGSASGTSVADYTATQGQTVFTLPWSYTQGIDNLAIFINGSKQVVNVNYTESTTTSFTMASGLNAGDIVQAIYNLPLAGGIIDASNVIYNEGSTGAVNSTVKTKLQESVSVMDFGADPTASTDASTAFQNAINALSSIGGGTLTAVGQFRLNSQVNLASNITYDFTGSTFYKGSSVDYLFSANTNKENILFKGATFKTASYTPTFYDPVTGTYGIGVNIQVVDSSYITIEDCRFYGYYGNINIENTSQFITVQNCLFYNNNAAVAAAVRSYSTGDMHHINILNNYIYGCGDDSIYVGGSDTNYDVYYVNVIGNHIDRISTTSTGAVPLRFGAYNTPGNTSTGGATNAAVVSNNIISSSPTQAIFISQFFDSVISNNTLYNNGRTVGGTNITFGQGTVGGPVSVSNVIIEGNIVHPLSSTASTLYMENCSNMTISNNRFLNNSSSVAAIYSNSSSKVILNNNYITSYNASIPGIQTTLTSDYWNISNNDIDCVFKISLTGTHNSITHNTGYVSTNSGLTTLGTTGMVISHGLSAAPACVNVTPYAGAVTGLYVYDITSTTFTINWSGGGSHYFYWSANLAQGN